MKSSSFRGITIFPYLKYKSHIETNLVWNNSEMRMENQKENGNTDNARAWIKQGVPTIYLLQTPFTKAKT